jgi:hypothetical protein
VLCRRRLPETAELDGFERRFSEILATSAGGWVNLEPETVADGVLIVAVVWRPEPAGHRTLPVSVNRSGFTAAEVKRLSVEASRGGGAETA